MKGEIVVEGEGIYLTVNFYNAEHLKDVYVGGQYSFRVDPADDLYVFIFDNTEGSSKSLVRFRLEEIWTRPMAIGSPPLFILGLIGFSSFLAGSVTLAITHTTRYLSHHIRLRKARCYLGDRKILADDVPVKRALALNIFVAIIKLNVTIRQIFE